MLMFSGGHDGFRKEMYVRVGEQKLKISSHIAQLHGEIFALHGH